MNKPIAVKSNKYYLLRGKTYKSQVLRNDNIETYITMCKVDKSVGICCMMQGAQSGAHLEGWGGVGGGREVQEGGDICTPMADSR